MNTVADEINIFKEESDHVKRDLENELKLSKEQFVCVVNELDKLKIMDIEIIEKLNNYVSSKSKCLVDLRKQYEKLESESKRDF